MSNKIKEQQEGNVRDICHRYGVEEHCANTC